MRKFIIGLAAATLTIGTTGPALAGSGSLGKKRCNEGSVSTKAYGNYIITFNAYIPNSGAYTLHKGTDDSVQSWKRVYWSVPASRRVEYASKGSASNSGQLSNLAWFCDT